MHEFDKFVMRLKEEFDCGTRAARNKEYHRVATAAARARKKGDMAKFLAPSKQLKLLPYTVRDSSYRRISYCRYADDWIIGVRGSLAETNQILDKCREFLASTLGLTLSPNKTKVTCLTKDKVLFLGAHILRGKISHTKEARRKVMMASGELKSKGLTQKRGMLLRLEAPIQRVRDKLTQAGFISQGRPNPKTVWIALNRDQIVSLYNSIIRGYANYYRFAANYGKLISFVRWVTFFSCARTLAAKENISVAKITGKYGINLGDGMKQTALIKPQYTNYSGAQRFLVNKMEPSEYIAALYARGKSMANLFSLSCSACGSTHKVEMPHARGVGDLNPAARPMDKLLAKANRKQIPLCRVCHMEAHRPKDGN